MADSSITIPFYYDSLKTDELRYVQICKNLFLNVRYSESRLLCAISDEDIPIDMKWLMCSINVF